jgi:hypothetical protein
MKFLDEFTHYIFLAIALTFFIIGFRCSLKVVAAKSPLPEGLQELLAS